MCSCVCRGNRIGPGRHWGAASTGGLPVQCWHACARFNLAAIGCIYVETRGIRLLFDAGISGKQAGALANDRDIRRVDALVISHDHSDPPDRPAFQRKFGLPVYLTADTLDGSVGRLGISGGTRLFHAGDPLVFGG